MWCAMCRVPLNLFVCVVLYNVSTVLHVCVLICIKLQDQSRLHIHALLLAL